MAQPSNPKIEELRFRLKTDPKSRLFYPLAEELRKVGSFEEGESVLRTGLESHPTYLSAWVSLGRVLRDQKKDGDAVTALSKALTLDPGNVVAARLLADAYLALGEKVEAIKKYKLVHALLPSDEELVVVIEKLAAEIQRDSAPEAAAPEPSAPEPTLEFPAPALVTDAAASESPFAEEPSAPVSEPIPFPEPTVVADEAPLFAPPVQEAPFGASGRFDETSPWLRPKAAPEPEPEAPSPEAPSDEAIETGDVEPMRVAHAESPFEEPVSDGGYSAAAFEVEAPQGMQVIDTPVTAEVPAPVIDEEADVFAPTESASAADAEAEEFTNTLTMADLYARQGLIDDARHIYENILSRDPGNATVREKLLALDPPVAAPVAAPEPVPPPALATIAPSPRGKVERLERWLAKVNKREAGRV